MKKCKNELCINLITENRTYCSQSCRSIWTNKNLKDYSKVSRTILNNTSKKEIEYNKNPKLCKNCNEIIPYGQKRKLFCNHTCSAVHSNRNRIVEERNLSYEGLQNILNANKLHSNILRLKYDANYKICPICNKNVSYEKRENKFCSKKCYSVYRKGISKLTEYQYYKSLCKFKFNVFDYPNEFDLHLIQKYGFYKASNNGNNIGGASRDHKISITDGFRNGILPYYVSHPANCQLMIHSDNISKNKNSSITLDELIEKIKIWKYK